MAKQVTLKKLALANFKGLRNVVIDFGEVNTSISGRNGTGKTTIKDAFNWLLWGKDSEGNDSNNFGIKTNDEEGNPIPDLEHRVTGTFQIVDTETGAAENVELRRAWVEEWEAESPTAPRKLKKHHTDFFYNDVPVKKSEYEEKVNAIIPETVFKLITDPYSFLTLHWKAQRETLLEIAGTITPESVAKDNAQFAALLDKLTGKTLEEYRREVGAKKARIETRLKAIPSEITAIARVTPTAPDYTAVEAQKAEIERQISEIDEAATSAAEANRIAYQQAADIQAQIGQKQAEQQKVLHEAMMAARESAFKLNEARTAATRELSRVEGEARMENTAYQNRRSNLQTAASQCDIVIADYKGQQDRLRKEWHELNEKTFKEGDTLICPLFHSHCADPEAIRLYQAQRDTARENFNADKAKKLQTITERGRALGEKIAEQEERKARALSELQAEETRHAEANARLNEESRRYSEAVAATPEVKAPTGIEPTTLPEWSRLQAEIEGLRQSLAPIGEGYQDVAEIRQKKAELTKQRDEATAKLNLRATITRNEEEMTQLRAEADTLAQEKANCQSEEDIIAAFTRAQMEEVEKRVNGLFSRVSFRMFRTLVNGNREDCCIAYVDGVSYTDVNTAGKINAGLDVINALCLYNRVTAPIFIDNAESVNTLIPVCSQLVRLVVTTGDFNVEPF